MARSGGDSLNYWAIRQGATAESRLKADSLRAKLLMQRRMVAERSEWQQPSQAVPGHGSVDMSWADGLPPCPVYSPTKEEFEDPLEYIQRIAPEASKFGICKVVSPLVASVPAGYVLSREKSGFKFTPRVQPMRLSNWDSTDMHKFLISGQQYTFHEYEKMANKFFTRRFNSTACLPPKVMEAEFWKELNNGKINVEYGCDIEGSAFSSSPHDQLGRSKWNLNNFSHLADSTLRLLETAIPGVTEPMMYIGMAFAMFAWHVEDHYLFSINYHHCGAPKTWYGVPGHAAPEFEQVVRDHVYAKELLAAGHEGLAYDLLIGKTTMFCPKLLVERNVPTYRAIQSPGEFVITFPRAYHAGFSHGFNCSEAVNFTMGDWFPFGTAACIRYELLKRVPLLPHEELLCKEAISVAGTPSIVPKGGRQDVLPPVSDNTLKRRHSVKVEFVRFMRFQHQVRWLLQLFGAQTIFRSPGFDGSVMCVLCKHMCYLAFVTCGCSATPMCLNHAKEIRECNCGSGRSVVVREGLSELERSALKFEEEEGIKREVRRHPVVDVATTLNSTMTEENMLGSEDYKGYIPMGAANSASAKVSSSLTTQQAIQPNRGGPLEANFTSAPKAVMLRTSSPVPVSVVFRGSQSVLSSSTVSVLPSKLRKGIADSDPTVFSAGSDLCYESCDSCRWGKDCGDIGEHLSDGKVHLPPSAKRKRSSTTIRKAPANGKLHVKMKGEHMEKNQRPNVISDDDDDDDDYDDDADEDYWPP